MVVPDQSWPAAPLLAMRRKQSIGVHFEAHRRIGRHIGGPARLDNCLRVAEQEPANLMFGDGGRFSEDLIEQSP